jgi:phage FluMu protein Com
MICNKCGRDMLDYFDSLKLEHVYKCPNCNYSNMTTAVNEAPAPDFRSMNGIVFAKHAVEEQMYIDPEDCAEAIKFDYNPFKELREEFEQNLLTYRNDKDTLIDILSSTVNLLLRTLEVTHAYHG